jgi:hypothetical protein
VTKCHVFVEFRKAENNYKPVGKLCLQQHVWLFFAILFSIKKYDKEEFTPQEKIEEENK